MVALGGSEGEDISVVSWRVSQALSENLIGSLDSDFAPWLDPERACQIPPFLFWGIKLYANIQYADFEGDLLL